MRLNSYYVSLKTLLATSNLLGHDLEDRSPVCDTQDTDLFAELSEQTAAPLRGWSQRELFCVAPLDILVSQDQSRKQFHLLELNGTGIGGLTNMPHDAVGAVLESLTEFCTGFSEPGLVLLAVSGKESDESPRLNRLMHEKLLFADAMRIGLEERFGSCDVATMAQLETSESGTLSSRPTVVVGYIKELLNALTCDEHGGLWLAGRKVAGAVNDRFCQNVVQRFEHRVDLLQLRTLNRCFVPGSDKGVAYGLVNALVRSTPSPSLPKEVRYTHAYDRAALIEHVLNWVDDGRQVVIKPHGTGLGHGIEFFLDPSENTGDIIHKIDESLSQTEEFYGVAGGALPYTVCEYVDACRVSGANHHLEGHKYELRVVAYRDGSSIKAMPSIAKIARERAEEGGSFERRALINNITASGDTHKVCGTDYMLPLCNQETMEVLGLSKSDLLNLCSFTTSLVRHTLDQIEDNPQAYGLPAPVVSPAAHLLRAA